MKSSVTALRGTSSGGTGKGFGAGGRARALGPGPRAALCSLPRSRGMSSVAWAGTLKSTHYWDCNGQGCDATVLQPWDASSYWSPSQYAPQDPEDHGGPSEYGEKMWFTGAASDALADLLGDDDGCCGSDTDSTGCGKCVLLRNPGAVQADWRAIAMKKGKGQVQFATVFLEKTRDEWAEIFYGTDACCVPVLNAIEAERAGDMVDHDLVKGIVTMCARPATVRSCSSSRKYIASPASPPAASIARAVFRLGRAMHA